MNEFIAIMFFLLIEINIEVEKSKSSIFVKKVKIEVETGEEVYCYMFNVRKSFGFQVLGFGIWIFLSGAL